MKVLLKSSDSPDLLVVEATSCTAAVFDYHSTNATHGFVSKVTALPETVESVRVKAVTMDEHNVVFFHSVFCGRCLPIPFQLLEGLEDDPTTLFNPYAETSDDLTGAVTLRLIAEDGVITPYGRELMR